MKKRGYICSLIALLTIFSGCGKDEFTPYDHPFIHIMSNEMSDIVIGSDANFIGTYTVYLSSKKLDETVEVIFSVITGDGLVSGVDYELVNASKVLTFPPGVYEAPIRIRWKPNVIDPAKNNVLKIRLESNNMNFTMGLPGKDENQREFRVTKNN